ncbi:hypothetical protein [Soonwooa sp.]|uniref:hypothetical protein n=1 Tax=Soonwooa sp. TaxID=1938592 RepID=UPI0028A9D000|nr:hypothetical protein [Soonwooa sp.]
MKSNILLISSIVISTFTFAQEGRVGINTTSPAATLDVIASPTITTRIDGFIAPRLTGEHLKAKDALYTNAQDAAIVYVTEALTATTDKTANVTKIGYYYFDKTKSTNGQWIRIINSNTTLPYQEPWNIKNTTTSAIENTQNIYQKGTVAIKKIKTTNGADLDIAGSIRVGSANSIAVVGQNCIAVGNRNIARNINSAAFGGGNTTNGQYPLVGGKDNIVGTESVNTSGFLTTVFGENNKVNHILSLVNGYANDLTGADGQRGTNFVNGTRNKILSNSS